MKSLHPRFARVVIPSPLQEPLTYRIPADIQGRLEVGRRVLVPLGKRKVTGVVFQLLNESALPDLQLKEIVSVEDPQPVLDAPLLELSQWISQYYLAGLGQVLATVLPPTMRTEVRKTLVLKAHPGVSATTLEKRVVEWLRQRNGKGGLHELRADFPQRRLQAAVEALHAAGAVEIRETIPGRRRKTPDALPGHPVRQRSAAELLLTEEQQGAIDAIGARIEKGGFETFLLHGVTGSGKTEVYLRAMETVRARGRRSLILAPEISLTPQLIDRLEARFPGRVGVLHSRLSGAERWNQWWQILRGNVDVVVGARSAVFAPVPALGLIVVDEEHDASYKQEEGVRYNGRDVAIVRGKLSRCPVILGSATPAVESYENARQGRYRLLRLTRRVQARPLPRVEIIDLRAGGSADDRGGGQPSDRTGRHLISDRLAAALKDNCERGRQSLIFLNRRGFSNFLQCRACGYVLRCAHCSVTLTFHRQQRAAHCHHCNFRRRVTDLCPGCGHPALGGVGAGTEQIEHALRALLPAARVGRMDRDTTTGRGSHERLLRRWEKAELDLLIGTQMVTKGHDVGGVTLVGALLADLSLNLPDFRAAEKTFQLLAQVAGRAGRGDEPGAVLIQTFSPDHYAILHLIQNDYESFFAAELEFRRALNYPPFCRLVQLRLEGGEAEAVEAQAKELGLRLRSERMNRTGDLEILGPAPAPIKKLRNRYRWLLLLKGKKARILLEAAKQAREWIPRSRSIRLHVDVDPTHML